MANVKFDGVVQDVGFDELKVSRKVEEFYIELAQGASDKREQSALFKAAIRDKIRANAARLVDPEQRKAFHAELLIAIARRFAQDKLK